MKSLELLHEKFDFFTCSFDMIRVWLSVTHDRGVTEVPILFPGPSKLKVPNFWKYHAYRALGSVTCICELRDFLRTVILGCHTDLDADSSSHNF